jgi:hypothetical protein
MCAAEPTCWYDVNGKGCLEGSRPDEDRCAVHEDEGTCSTDKSLGCAWNAGATKCVTKAE